MDWGHSSHPGGFHHHSEFWTTQLKKRKVCSDSNLRWFYPWHALLLLGLTRQCEWVTEWKSPQGEEEEEEGVESQCPTQASMTWITFMGPSQSFLELPMAPKKGLSLECQLLGDTTCKLEATPLTGTESDSRGPRCEMWLRQCEPEKCS